MNTKWAQVESKGMTFNVSSSGLIATQPRTVSAKRFKNGKMQDMLMHQRGKILSSCITNNGYLEVTQQVNKVRKKFSVHRLIALAFVPGHFDGATVNHINGDKLDNRIENLEWVTLSRNTHLEWETGLANLRGENQPRHKLSSRQVRIIRKALRLGLTGVEIGEICKLNVTESTIYSIKQGRRWNHLTE